MHDPDFAEVRETFRRAFYAKSGTDNKKPKTMKYRETFLKHKKKNLHELDEHYKNLTSLQRRLGSIGSVSSYPIQYTMRSFSFHKRACEVLKSIINVGLYSQDKGRKTHMTPLATQASSSAE